MRSVNTTVRYRVVLGGFIMLLYSITVDLGDPQGDNDVLMEALAIAGAKRLTALRREREWLAVTSLQPAQVRILLNRCAKGDDRVEVKQLSGSEAATTIRALLNAS